MVPSRCTHVPRRWSGMVEGAIHVVPGGSCGPVMPGGGGMGTMSPVHLEGGSRRPVLPAL